MGLASPSGPARECPYLFSVMADRLWLAPRGMYCRRPDGPVRIPASTTVACMCMTAAHLVCPGYLASTGRVADTPGSRT
jgi:hypothetical protein